MTFLNKNEGGMKMNKKILFPVLFAVLMLFVFAAPANAWDLEEITCTDTMHGDWLANTCTIDEWSYNLSTDVTIDINSGITLKINAVLGNFGFIHINNGGILNNSGTIYNAETFGTILTACGGTFTNSGTFIGDPVQYEPCGPTLAQNTQNLINDVETLNIQHGIENSLVVKLNAAIQEIQANNNAEAINSLQAFINEVKAQRGKKISESDADILIVAAQAIISQLTGP